MPTTMGGRVKTIRRAWKWSQAELARVLKVDQATISFWERDLVKPGGTSILALASLFRVKLEAFEDGQAFTLPEPPSPPDMVGEARKGPRSVCLPLGGPHLLTVVDLEAGSSCGSALSEAMVSLAEGTTQNRRVWLVLE